MRKHPRVANRPAVEQCLCNTIIGYVCSIHRGQPAKTPDVSSKLADPGASVRTCSEHTSAHLGRYALTRPWNPDDLPPYLRGYGHHTGWSTNINGEWVMPEEDKEGEFMRAVGILFECDVTE